MSAAEDQADVERVQAGDISAFEGNCPPVAGADCCAWRTEFRRDRGRAEEMAQEAFSRRLPVAERSGGRKQPFRLGSSPWQRICIAQSFSAFRRAQFRSTISRKYGTLRAVHGGLRIKKAIETALFGKRVACPFLPEYREALILFYFHDMDIPAAARSLGLPEGTVKTRLFRGRRPILRSKLTKTLGAPGLE